MAALQGKLGLVVLVAACAGFGLLMQHSHVLQAGLGQQAGSQLPWQVLHTQNWRTSLRSHRHSAARRGGAALPSVPGLPDDEPDAAPPPPPALRPLQTSARQRAAHRQAGLHPSAQAAWSAAADSAEGSSVSAAGGSGVDAAEGTFADTAAAVDAGALAAALAADEPVWQARRAAVREAMQWSWDAYANVSFGMDELLPVSRRGVNNFGALGATLVDSLDTLWLMNLTDEFDRAADWVLTGMELDRPIEVSLFETTIRVVGGLVAAHDLAGRPALLERARGLLDRLMYAFDTSDVGIPHNMVNLTAGVGPTGDARKELQPAVLLAELGTFGVEFEALTQRTGSGEYARRAEAPIRLMQRTYPGKGLLPALINRHTGEPYGTPALTVGAMADSYYEYLLKTWLMKGKQGEAGEMMRALWEAAMDDVLAQLLRRSPPEAGGLAYVGMTEGVTFQHRMHHLACYLPGNLALGVMSGAVAGAKAGRYLAAAGDLTHTCWQMYNMTGTGLAPESVFFHPRQGLQVAESDNRLRPEAVESLFYLWRATGQEQYREWGWAIFEAFRRHCRVPQGGYSGILDVRAVPAAWDDAQQSFWLAETLKYFWLLFSPGHVLPLERWVFNTEAHPLRIGAAGQLTASS